MALGGTLFRVAFLALVAAPALTGCSAGPSKFCLDDSGACVQQRLARLDAMQEDPQRQWIAQTPSTEEYASGVRQFAYRSTRGQLTCSQLSAGIAETAQARRVLAPSKVKDISAERVGQIIALSDDINRELKVERKMRCSG